MEYAGRDRVLPRMEHTTRTTLQTTSGAADGRYVFDQRRHDERERLAAMERLGPGHENGDRGAGDRARLALPGDRCRRRLDRSLARRPGRAAERGGRDRHQHPAPRRLDAPNIEVRHHDILCDPLPEGAFDLVHARLVVEHLGRRSLQRAASAVRPGGLLVLEDFDWGAALTYANTDRCARSWTPSRGSCRARGTTPTTGDAWCTSSSSRAFATWAPTGARACTGAQARAPVPAPELRVDRRGAALVGELMQEYLDWVLATLDDPDTVFLTPMFAAWGRKPQP